MQNSPHPNPRNSLHAIYKEIPEDNIDHVRVTLIPIQIVVSSLTNPKPGIIKHKNQHTERGRKLTIKNLQNQIEQHIQKTIFRNNQQEHKISLPNTNTRLNTGGESVTKYPNPTTSKRSSFPTATDSGTVTVQTAHQTESQSQNPTQSRSYTPTSEPDPKDSKEVVFLLFPILFVIDLGLCIVCLGFFVQETGKG